MDAFHVYFSRAGRVARSVREAGLYQTLVTVICAGIHQGTQSWIASRSIRGEDVPSAPLHHA
jgi:hypothetical protein